MHRLVRDSLIAVIGGAIISVITAFSTNLTRLEVAGVGAATIALCALIIGGMHVPGLIRNRCAAFKSQIVAAATEAVLTELASRIPEPIQNEPPALIPVAARNERPALQDLLVEGRVLQARLAEGDRSVPVGHELGAKIAGWEATTLNQLLMDDLRAGQDFRKSRSSFDDIFDDAAWKTCTRMSHELEILEIAIQDKIQGADRLGWS